MRAATGRGESGKQETGLPTQPAPRIVTGTEAIREAFRPFEWNEGPRIGIIGDSGTGKTKVAELLIAEYLQQRSGVVVVIDGKAGPSRFAGDSRRDLTDLADNPPRSRVVILRGDPSAGVDVDPDAAARLQWRLSEASIESLAVYDELSEAAETDRGGGWKRGVAAIPRAFRQGRGAGIASLWGTQSPQDAPRAAFEQSSVILCSRLAGRGLKYLCALDYAQGAEHVIPELPGDESPGPKRGKFVLLRRGRPWDGALYDFATLAQAPGRHWANSGQARPDPAR